jgi:DNA ligase (NAD+)
MESMRKIRSVKLETLLIGLGIPLMGVSGVKQIVARYKTLHELLCAALSFDIVDDIPRSMVDWLRNADSQRTLHYLFWAGLTIAQPRAEQSQGIEPSALLKVCITGTFYNLTRAEAANALGKAGFEYSSSVTKGTTHLAVGQSPGITKVSQARKLGIPFLSEEEFMAMCGLK